MVKSYVPMSPVHRRGSPDYPDEPDKRRLASEAGEQTDRLRELARHGE